MVSQLKRTRIYFERKYTFLSSHSDMKPMCILEFFGELKFWILVFEYCSDLTERGGVVSGKRPLLRSSINS